MREHEFGNLALRDTMQVTMSGVPEKTIMTLQADLAARLGWQRQLMADLAGPVLRKLLVPTLSAFCIGCNRCQ